jgi:predicted nucleic-acid-binding Zn-ribbon protein
VKCGSNEFRRRNLMLRGIMGSAGLLDCEDVTIYICNKCGYIEFYKHNANDRHNPRTYGASRTSKIKPFNLYVNSPLSNNSTPPTSLYYYVHPYRFAEKINSEGV